MSIPKPDSIRLSKPSGVETAEEGWGTDLIRRLANEFFLGSTDRLPQPPSAATVLPGSENGLPGFPTSLPPAAPGAPTTPAAAADQDLAGGFPPATASTHPPVHPVLESAEPSVSAKEPSPISGAHDPECRDSHPFGEPRCHDPIGEQAGLQAPPFWAIHEEDDARRAPSDLYFLNGRNGIETPLLGRRASATVPAQLSSLDVEAVRRDFPALHQRVNGKPLIWLDNAATTHKPQSVIDATNRFYSRDNSNIHRAAHTLAARSTELFENGREKARQFLGAADAKEIVFVRGTTEAINLVAQSYGRKNIGAGDEIILTELEHHANIVPWQLLAESTGALLRVVPINDRGELVLDEYVKAFSSRTKFVSVAHVSNALGTINPVEEIVALAHARGVPVLVDGAQSTPHLPVNVQAIGADFYVFSGHKIFGPTGIGVLYGKSALLEAMPPWQGGGHMIRDVRFEKTIYQRPPEKFEAGTPDIAGVVGLTAAIDYLLGRGLPAIAAYEHALLEYATDALSSVPGLRLIGTASNKASVLSFVIPRLENATIARHLDRQGIAVRAGHHCAMPAQRHFGLESTVRPSLAFYNTFAEIDTLVEALHQLPKSDQPPAPAGQDWPKDENNYGC